VTVIDPQVYGVFRPASNDELIITY
jgi:hypothetical protein